MRHSARRHRREPVRQTTRKQEGGREESAILRAKPAAPYLSRGEVWCTGSCRARQVDFVTVRNNHDASAAATKRPSVLLKLATPGTIVSLWPPLDAGRKSCSRGRLSR